ATVFADERYRLPDDVRAHPGLVWCLAASDWDEGATWTSARGSAPLALSADGAPTQNTIPAELIYSESEACWQGAYHYRSANLSTGHRLFRRDPFATMRLSTEAERIDVEAVVEFSSLNQQGWGSVSARKDAGEVASSLFALDAAGYPQVHRLRLEPG